jgi:hypothetical protein
MRGISRSRILLTPLSELFLHITMPGKRCPLCVHLLCLTLGKRTQLAKLVQLPARFHNVHIPGTGGQWLRQCIEIRPYPNLHFHHLINLLSFKLWDVQAPR